MFPVLEPQLTMPDHVNCKCLKRVGIFYLQLGFYVYSWSLLLTVIRFGLFCLQLKFRLVFFAYGGKLVWSFLAYSSLRLEIWFGLFYLRFPHRKQKRRTVIKKTSTVNKKDASA